MNKTVGPPPRFEKLSEKEKMVLKELIDMAVPLPSETQVSERRMANMPVDYFGNSKHVWMGQFSPVSHETLNVGCRKQGYDAIKEKARDYKHFPYCYTLNNE